MLVGYEMIIASALLAIYYLISNMHSWNDIVKYPGVTWSICNVLQGWLRGQKNEQQNNVPN